MECDRSVKISEKSVAMNGVVSVLLPDMEHCTVVIDGALCKLFELVLVLGWLGNVVVHRVPYHG